LTEGYEGVLFRTHYWLIVQGGGGAQGLFHAEIQYFGHKGRQK
jgi:hypothetical protein